VLRFGYYSRSSTEVTPKYECSTNINEGILPLFLDRHYIEGTDEKDIAAAHEQDLSMQEEYNAKFLTYWHDEGRHTTFCLVSADSADLITTIHSKAHGKIPNDIVEVNQTDVMSFMGRIADIPASEQKDGLSVDKALRTIMFTDLVGYTSMMSRLGDDRAFKLLREHNNVVRDALTKYAGREVKHTGDGIMASVDDADHAVRAAIEIRAGIADISIPDTDEKLSIRIGMTSGEPLEEGGDLFGSVVNLASRLCDLAEAGEILLSEECVAELTDDAIGLESIGNVSIRGFDEAIAVSKVAD
jgi:class 3 adenylate cyclase